MLGQSGTGRKSYLPIASRVADAVRFGSLLGSSDALRTIRVEPRVDRTSSRSLPQHTMAETGRALAYDRCRCGEICPDSASSFGFPKAVSANTHRRCHMGRRLRGGRSVSVGTTGPPKSRTDAPPRSGQTSIIVVPCLGVGSRFMAIGRGAGACDC